MTRVVVVGGAGFIGRAVCSELARRGVEVVVVDRARASGVRSIDIVAARAGEELRRAFAGADAVVHLAARVDPPAPRERDAMRRLHVDGTLAVVRAARGAGVPRFVLASSATVYGAWPDNPVPLEESAALRPNAELAYAVDKAEQERIVDAEGRGLSLAIARPAIVYGPGVKNYLTELLRRAPMMPALDGKRPPLQFVHIDDVASAFTQLALGTQTGAFNVASADWLSFDDVARARGKRVVPVPRALVVPTLNRIARYLPPHLRVPAGMAPYLMFPFVMSTTKLEASGWTPRYTSRDALRTI